MTDDRTNPAGGSSKGSPLWVTTRQSLIERIQGEGEVDQASWGRFYDLYWRGIFGYARSIGVPQPHAEDIVQEVMIKVLRNLPRFEYDEKRGRFRAWLRTITRNTVYDFVRRLKARPAGHGVSMDAEQLPPGLEEELAHDAPNLLEAWDKEYDRGLLMAALDRVKTRVSPDTYEAFVRYALREEPASEITAALGITAQSLHSTKNRLIQMLRVEFSALCEQEA